MLFESEAEAEAQAWMLAAFGDDAGREYAIRRSEMARRKVVETTIADGTCACGCGEAVTRTFR